MMDIDGRLAYRNRTLRTRPDKLLFGPSGNCLFVDYQDKIPGIWGRIDYIHKQNIPGLFCVTVEGDQPRFDGAEAIWYPSHLHMSYEDERLSFTEDKFITEDDVAVSCQRWENRSEKPVWLHLHLCKEAEVTVEGSIARFSLALEAHHIKLHGIVAANVSFFPHQRYKIPANSEATFTIACGVSEARLCPEAEIRETVLKYVNRQEPLGEHIKQYAAWFSDVPSFSSSEPLLETVWAYRWYILKNSYIHAKLGNFQHGLFYEGKSHKVKKDPYSPSGHEFTQFIPLSTPLHVTDARWKANAEPCSEALRSLVDSMDENGMFRTMMTDRFGVTYGNFCEWALYRYYLVHLDGQLIADLLSAMKQNIRGLLRVYSDGKDTLQIAYNHRWTGKEYQPSYWHFRNYPDNAADEDSYDRLKRVDLSVYFFLNTLAVQKLCHIVNDPEEAEFRHLAERVKTDIMAKMWNMDEGFFFDLNCADDEQALVKNIVGIYPVWADMADEPCYQRVTETLLDPNEFAVGSGFSSVSKKCPVYMPQGSWKGYFFKGRDGCMWDGPSWPYTTCIALETIAKQSRKNDHRYDQSFGDLLRQYCWQHFRNMDLHAPYLVEHYNAETGEKLSDEADYNHSYYIDLIIRQVAGLEPFIGGFTVNPIDIGLDWFELKQVALQQHILSIYYKRDSKFVICVDGEQVFMSAVLCVYTYYF